ncbi:MAG: phosphatidylserine decarboxylase [Rickettsiales bacterium]|nr:phosphatidylserine decarboxylase [Rickettsiales bacterium]
MQNFIDALKLVSFPIHKEGYKFIIIFALITIIAALISNKLGLIGLVLTLWCIFFFRDPQRFTPNEANAIISPADGIVTLVENEVNAPDDLGFGDKKWRKISVFLNVFNVHVNRVPASGTITKIVYKAGKFLSANDVNATNENERNSVILKTDDGTEIVFVQVAGLVARRIVCDISEGQQVKAGDRYGIIRFGSRADIYLPLDSDLKITLGQTMIGGETIIAKLKQN